MSIPVKLQVFEGPLDLLLHLIDKNKVNIYDIPIVEITEQYLIYIKSIEDKNLDIMSEFLVMAATLIHIKSKMLLPTIDDEDEEDEIDPRQELVQRLLEYKKYKYVSKTLREKQLNAEQVMFKGPTIPTEIKDYKKEIPVESIMKDVDLTKLYKIFQTVIRKQEDKIDPIRSKFGEIEREEYSIQDKIDYIKRLKQNYKNISFKEFLLKNNSKQETIITFLAVLELMKTGYIYIRQEEVFEDINIEFNDI
ncbi:MAG: segregation and condensation protein A [Eubacteriales bacterium]